MVIFLRAIW